jgi:hypothetical protein
LLLVSGGKDTQKSEKWKVKSEKFAATDKKVQVFFVTLSPKPILLVRKNLKK